MGNNIELQWNAVKAAPIVYIAAIIFVSGIIWLIVNHLKSNQIESLEARLKLRDDEIADYRRQLDGASPDEAKARIDILEAKLHTLMPRRISADKREKIRRALSGIRSVISIGSDMACADAPALNSDLSAAFRNAEWQIENPSFMGLSNAPSSGIGVRCLDPANPTDAEAAVIKALKMAEIEFDVQPGRDVARHGSMPAVHAQIVITPRVLD
mgnify:CR=1 FL=1